MEHNRAGAGPWIVLVNEVMKQQVPQAQVKEDQEDMVVRTAVAACSIHECSL